MLLLLFIAISSCPIIASTFAASPPNPCHDAGLCIVDGQTCCSRGCIDGSCASIYFIGDSFLIKNDFPAIYAGLTAEQHVYVNADAIPSATLEYHDLQVKTTWAKLDARDNWTAVVLQEQSEFLSFGLSWAETYTYPYALAFAKAAKEKGAITILFETWGYEDGDQVYYPGDDYYNMQQRIISGYNGLDTYLGTTMNDPSAVIIAPVGEAWQLAYTAYQAIGKQGILYEYDGKHPSIYGSYLAACTVYATFFKVTPVGLKYIPKGLDPQEALTLQKYAAQATGF